MGVSEEVIGRSTPNPVGLLVDVLFAGTLLVGIFCECGRNSSTCAILTSRVSSLVNTYLYGLVTYQFAVYYNSRTRYFHPPTIML